MSANIKSIAVRSDAFKRLEAIAISEYRTPDGQIMAMCDLWVWEKTHGFRLAAEKQKIDAPPKLSVVQPIKKDGRGNYVKTKQHREKLSRALKGRVVSAETKLKISQTARLKNAKKRLEELKRQAALG